MTILLLTSGLASAVAGEPPGGSGATLSVTGRVLVSPREDDQAVDGALVIDDGALVVIRERRGLDAGDGRRPAMVR